MAKRKTKQRQRSATPSPSSQLEKLERQLQTQVQRKNYRQALDKLKQIHRSYPEAEISQSESQLWLLQGQQEYDQGDYSQAEVSLRKALNLGLAGEGHYWLAKCLLASDEIEAALTLIQEAFEEKVLPKDYAGCYLKLLFLHEDIETVQDLITHQSKRFYAAHLHWARGMLALTAEDPQTAITSFKKMDRRAVTPGDNQSVWIAYTQQQLGHWESLENALGLKPYSPFSTLRFNSVITPQHPALERLAIRQALTQQQSLLPLIERNEDLHSDPSLAIVLEALYLIDQSDYHEAAHLIQRLPQPCLNYPEVDDLRRPLLLLAGEQAIRDSQPQCAITFWEDLVESDPFDPKLALKLHLVYQETERFPQRQRLLSRLLDWVKTTARADSQAWPETRTHPILAKLYCWQTDVWMEMGNSKQGIRALKQAEQMSPTSAEVMGRQGLMAFAKNHLTQAIPLLTKALEQGCTYGDVYFALIESLEEQGEDQAIREVRQQFGKSFGDLEIEPELGLPWWQEALSTQNYRVFAQLVMSREASQDPALQACQIFVESVEDEPNAAGRVTLSQSSATPKWARLLQKLSPQEQIQPLQAIFLSLKLFAKRLKGIAALESQYLQQHYALGEQHPEVQEAHLVLLVVKGLAAERLHMALQLYLNQSPQPGTALAHIQLQARYYTQTDALRPLIDTALSQDAQNPQLLLAKATTFDLESQAYQDWHDQGFELARRLQDAPALQAYRAEEAFQSGMMAQAVFPDLTNFAESGEIDLADVMRKMAQQMFGSQVPPELLERMLPELVDRMMDDLPDFGDEDEDDFFELDPLNAGLPFGRSRSKSKPKKAKRGFQF